MTDNSYSTAPELDRTGGGAEDCDKSMASTPRMSENDVCQQSSISGQPLKPFALKNAGPEMLRILEYARKHRDAKDQEIADALYLQPELVTTIMDSLVNKHGYFHRGRA